MTLSNGDPIFLRVNKFEHYIEMAFVDILTIPHYNDLVIIII
jgi:hypothetical protein